MNMKEFNQGVGKILGLKSGEVTFARIEQNASSGEMRVTFQIKATPKQKQRFLEFIIQQAKDFKSTR